MATPDPLIPAETYKQILSLMPVVCVDLLVMKAAQYLLVKRKDEPLKGEWWVPGGRILKGEAALEACYRKLRSETGLSPSNGFRFVGYYEDFYDTSAFEVPCHTVSLVYETTVGEQDVQPDPTIDSYRWEWGLPPRLKFRLKP